MAKKLYIFGIGGTGSRVLKAFTMLLASGCKLENDFDTVIPIIIDPDTSNGDLNRTKDILRLYQEIRNQIEQPDDFYKQEIKTINELANKSSVINPEYFQFNLEGVKQSTFGQYIGFDDLPEDFINSKDDKNFIRLLYSDSNLHSDLNVGFKGNPNMGSIVLNQFTNSENFKRFGQTFNYVDAIFIINSIFGGTGAAGFPLLLKNLRGNDQLPNHTIIQDSQIGGITYLPYFALDRQDEVKSDSFEEKAKIALEYYNRTIIENKQINTLYFIGNKGNTNYLKYSDGGKEQKNDAHFLELAGALAILDFCKNINNTPITQVKNTPITQVNNTPITQVNNTRITKVKEFGIVNDTENISFGDLNIENNKEILAPLTKFKLYTKYLKTGLPKALDVSRWTKSNIKLVNKSKNSVLDKNYFNSIEYKIQIEAFNKYFDDWLKEMSRNKPAFSPYNEVEWGNALCLLKNTEPKGNKSFKVLDIENCKLIDDISLKSTKEKKHTTLVKLFSRSTENILKKKKLLNR